VTIAREGKTPQVTEEQGLVENKPFGTGPAHLKRSFQSCHPERNRRFGKEDSCQSNDLYRLY
jgi:hypothetical protein